MTALAVQFELGSAMGRRLPGLGLREITGGTATLTAAGLSLSFTYNCGPLGRGTVISELTNPNGTETLLAKLSSDATESIRKRFEPLRVHSLVEAAGQ